MPLPSTTLSFLIVRGAIPAFGDTYEDVTRKGDTYLRMRYVGKRSAGATVTGIRFTDTKADALSLISSIEAAKGKEIILRDATDNLSWQVFVDDVSCEKPQRVWCTRANSNWRVTASLQVRATT